ncbi:hypothetical protein K2Y11_18505 [bacterium]|nr:hypothetical protein [bacterium]
MADHSPYQKKIIRRYYDNLSSISLNRLQELTTELYLAEGKKQDKLWTQVGPILQKLEVPQGRIDHILAKKDVKLIAEIVRELT